MGVAVSVTFEPSGKAVRLGFFATEPLPTTVIFTAAVNRAVMLSGRVTVMLSGFAVEVVSPTQFVKDWPEPGVAVSVTAWPWLYWVRSGFFAAVPVPRVD